MRLFDLLALSALATVPILWARARLPALDRDPPITDARAVRIGALVAAALSGLYIWLYVI